MDPLCLLVAGVVRATIPASEFTLEWQHSVEHTRWSERYAIVADQLVLTEARVQGFGAGMEPGVGATLRDGVWIWQPERRLAALMLTRSSYTSDYRMCWASDCRALADMVGPTEEGTAVTLRPCGRKSGSDPGFHP